MNEVVEVVHGGGPQSEGANRDWLGMSRLVPFQIDVLGIKMKKQGLKEGLLMTVDLHTGQHPTWRWKVEEEYCDERSIVECHMHRFAFAAQNIGCPDLRVVRLIALPHSRANWLTMASDLVGILVTVIATGLVNFWRKVTRKARTRRFSKGSLLMMRLTLMALEGQMRLEVVRQKHAHVDSRSSY